MVTIVEGDNVFDVQLVLVSQPEGSVSGIVTDYDTELPVSAVLVTIQGKNTSTNSSGAYTIMGLALGSFPLTFEKAGYETLIL